MLLCDVNVLLHALRPEGTEHQDSRKLVQSMIDADEVFGFNSSILAAVVRVATHPSIFTKPSPSSEALEFCERVSGAANSCPIEPKSNHWAIFAKLILTHKLSANDVTDAYFAALAIEHNCTWVTWDRGFRRFSELRQVAVPDALARLI